MSWAGIAKSEYRLAMGWNVRGSNSGGGEVLRTRPDRLWGPTSLFCYGRRAFFPGCKAAWACVDNPPPTGVQVKESIELYLYFPSRSSRPVLG